MSTLHLSTLSLDASVDKINCEDLHNYGFRPQRTRNSIGDIVYAVPGVADVSNAMPDRGDNFMSLVAMTNGLNENIKVTRPSQWIPAMGVAN
jgi:hypothetical protein